MARRESVFNVIVKGAMAGMAGTTALTSAMKSAPPVLNRFGLDLDEMRAPFSSKLRAKQEEPTEKLATKIGQEGSKTPMDHKTQQAAGQAIHWGYGAAGGALYGLIQNWLHLPHQFHGLLFGGMTALIAATVVPALGLTPRRPRQTLKKQVMPVLMHLLYGWVTARTFHSLTSHK